MTNAPREAMEAARHERVTLDGLFATDGMTPRETFTIDTKHVVAQLDVAFNAASETDSRPS